MTRRGALVLLLCLLAGSALAQASPFGVGMPEQGGGGLIPWIAVQQKQFYRELTAALKGLRENGDAFWWLAGLSLGYGVLHAAGPGHGKIVISSYLLANEQSAKRGVAIAFLAALVQAGVAILLVAVMAAVLGMTSFAITGTARAIEIGSYALIAGLGIYLLARKLRQLAASRRMQRAAAPVRRGQPVALGGGSAAHGDRHDHGRDEHHNRDQAHDHHHHHHSGCGHNHAPSPELAADVRDLRGAAAAVLSVGLRPCSGALIVLVFALAQGIFWAGIASTLLMALGTAITIAALAALAVSAKALAARLAGAGGHSAAVLTLGLELFGALLITALGLTLLVGALTV